MNDPDTFARMVAERRADADAVSAGDPRDDATVWASVLAGTSPESAAVWRAWASQHIGGRVPTRAELWVLIDTIPTTDDDDEESDWHEESVPLDDLHYDGSINQQLVDLLRDTMTGERQPDMRRVPIQNLVARPEEIVPEHEALLLAHPAPLPTRALPVVELSGNRFWAFDNTAALRGWKAWWPGATVEVDVLTRYESSAPALQGKANWQPNRGGY